MIPSDSSLESSKESAADYSHSWPVKLRAGKHIRVFPERTWQCEACTHYEFVHRREFSLQTFRVNFECVLMIFVGFKGLVYGLSSRHFRITITVQRDSSGIEYEAQVRGRGSSKRTPDAFPAPPRRPNSPINYCVLYYGTQTDPF
jgi:hypothetical protein